MLVLIYSLYILGSFCNILAFPLLRLSKSYLKIIPSYHSVNVAAVLSRYCDLIVLIRVKSSSFSWKYFPLLRMEECEGPPGFLY